jgi:hypothetical protein
LSGLMDRGVKTYHLTMPPTLNKTHECQIMRKIFSSCENTDKAIEAFKNLKIHPQDIEAVVRFDDKQTRDRDREYRECHDTAQRWLDGWANLEAFQTRRMMMPLLCSVPVGTTVFQYHE